MALYTVTAGNVIVTTDANQYYNLMTGVMTDQPVTLGNTMSIKGTSISLGYGVGQQVDYKLYNAGTVAEWSMHQPIHASNDNFIISKIVSGVYTDAINIYPSTGVFIGGSPTDPGAGQLSIATALTVGGNITTTAACTLSNTSGGLTINCTSNNLTIQTTSTGLILIKPKGVTVIQASDTTVTIGSGIELITTASGTGNAGFNIPHGTAPTSPVNGDIWTTTSGMFVRINGATVGPLT